MNKRIVVFAVLLIGLTISSLTAQEKDAPFQFVTNVAGVGTSAATFLEIGVGARAVGMGGSYVAVANDASALYWNPAGIAWVNSVQSEMMHTEWLAGTKFDFVGLAVPVAFFRSSFGVSFTSLDYGESPVRTVDRPEGTGERYGAHDFAVGLTYAVALTDRFSFGITGKYISQRIWSEAGNTMAVDLGVFYNTMFEGLKLAAAISNFGGEIGLSGRHLTTIHDPDIRIANFDRVPVDYKVGSYPLPLLFRVGISYQKQFGQFGDILLAMDVLHPSNTTESINLGMEYGFGNMFYCRAGYQNLFERDSINGLTLGGGIDYYLAGRMGIRVDYAWSDWGILENTQRFSLGLVF